MKKIGIFLAVLLSVNMASAGSVSLICPDGKRKTFSTSSPSKNTIRRVCGVAMCSGLDPVEERADGCSGPLPSEATPACNIHDVCYGTLFRSKIDCDREFATNVLTLDRNNSFVKPLVAIGAYAAVASHQGGQSGYSKGQGWAFYNNCAGKSDVKFAFYEGNSCDQEMLGFLTEDKATYNLKKTSQKFMSNDEARSVKLFSPSANTILRVYDSPNFSYGDDVTSIVMKRSGSTSCIGSFERSRNFSKYMMRHSKKNGLDGKISAVKVTRGAEVYFYRENSCKGKIRQLMNVSNRRTEKKGSGLNHNDDYRSIYLADVPAGLEIKVCDSDRCSSSDDIATITTKRTYTGCINSFEGDQNTSNYKVDFRRKNGLDGKVSRIEVRP